MVFYDTLASLSMDHCVLGHYLLSLLGLCPASRKKRKECCLSLTETEEGWFANLWLRGVASVICLVAYGSMSTDLWLRRSVVVSHKKAWIQVDSSTSIFHPICWRVRADRFS